MDVSLFIYSSVIDRVYLLVYVDDILIMGSNSSLVEDLLAKLAGAFKICDMGRPHLFLGAEMVPDDTSTVLSHRHYMRDILQWTPMEECKPLATLVPMSAKPGVSDEATFKDPTRYCSLAGAL